MPSSMKVGLATIFLKDASGGALNSLSLIRIHFGKTVGVDHFLNLC